MTSIPGPCPDPGGLVRKEQQRSLMSAARCHTLLFAARQPVGHHLPLVAQATIFNAAATLRFPTPDGCRDR